MTKRVWDQFYKRQKLSKKFGKYIFDYSKPDKDIIRLAPFFKKEKINKILDLGCGEGRNSRFLSGKGFEVIGVDISKIAIQKAKKADNKAKYLNANMKKIPFQKDFFDAIISIQTIFHEQINGIRKTIREISRVTKNQGLVFITLQPVRGNESFMGKKLENGTYIASKGDDKGEIHHFFTKSEILKEFKNFDFIKLYLKPKLNYWYILLKNQK